MAVAKALGARRVIAVDIQQDRLDFAKSYAATDIYLPVRLCISLPTCATADNQPPKDKDEDADDYCSRVANQICGDLNIPAMGPGAIDLTIEASGAPTCIQIGVHVLKPA
jgi:D-xylulose reductase